LESSRVRGGEKRKEESFNIKGKRRRPKHRKTRRYFFSLGEVFVALRISASKKKKEKRKVRD